MASWRAVASTALAACILSSVRGFTQPDTSAYEPPTAAIEEQEYTVQHTCTLSLQGSASTPSVTAALATQTAAAPSSLASASVSCQSSDGSQLVVYGGSGIAPFASSFTGVQFVTGLQLPGPTLYLNGSSVLVTGSTFSGVAANQQALLVVEGGTLIVENSTFMGNTGSIACIQGIGSNITLIDSSFTNNSAGDSGAVYMVGGGVSVFNSVLTGNSGAQGGAVGWVNGTSASFIDSSFTSNNASSGGAVFAQLCTGTLTLGDSTVTYNTATQNGGGLFLQQCNGVLVNTDYKHNSAQNGGAVFGNAGLQLAALSNNFTSNVGTASAGGMQLQSIPNTTVQACIFNSNVGNKGAGLYMGSANGSLSNNWFLGNSATTSGGAFFRTAGTGGISGSTFTANSAKMDGGAIFDTGSSGSIVGNTFSNNTAPQGSAVYRDSCNGTMSSNTGLSSSAVDQVGSSGSSGSSTAYDEDESPTSSAYASPEASTIDTTYG